MTQLFKHPATLRELEMMLVATSCLGNPEGHDHGICQSIPAARTAELLGYLIGHLHACEPDGEDHDLMFLLTRLRAAIRKGRAEDLKG